MPAFEYQVKDRAGKDQIGVQEAADVGALVASLRSQGFIVIRINEVNKKNKGISVSKGPKKVGKAAVSNWKIWSFFPVRWRPLWVRVFP